MIGHKHHAWSLSIAAALILLIAEPFAAEWARDSLSRKIDAAKAQSAMLRKQMAQWEEDAAITATTGAPMDKAQALRFTEPFVTPTMIRRVESAAAAARLFNVAASASAPRVWTGEGLFEGLKGVEERTLTVTADAPHDGDILTFLSRLDRIDGRLRLTQLTVKPIEGVPHDQSRQSVATPLNLRMEAAFAWIVNASLVQENGEVR